MIRSCRVWSLENEEQFRNILIWEVAPLICASEFHFSRQYGQVTKLIIKADLSSSLAYLLLFSSTQSIQCILHFEKKFFKHLFILFLGCVESSLLHWNLLQLQQAGAALQLWCEGFSLQWPLSLWSMDSRQGMQPQQLWHKACEIFLDEGWNPCPLHGQANTGPPGKPLKGIFDYKKNNCPEGIQKMELGKLLHWRNYWCPSKPIN